MRQDTPGAKATQKKYPQIYDAYAIYLLCRETALYEYHFSRNKKEYVLLLEHTTGLKQLPYAGGIMDQPVKLMTYFEEFLAGDEHGFHERIANKK